VWERLDLVVASVGLAVQAEVLDKLDGEPLLDRTEPTASDHLPVAGTVDLL
jgi:hypothetical protein